MRPFRSLLLTAFVLATSAGANASSVIFSNFQANALLCECFPGSGSPLGPNDFDAGDHWVRGDEFTVTGTTDFTLDSLELSVGLSSGPVNELDIFLYSNVSDVHPDVNPGPFQLLESFRVDNQMAPFGQDAPPVVADSLLHPVLTSGHSYWLLVTTATLNSSAGWYQNNDEEVGLTGWSLDNDSLCCVYPDLQDTFAVLGTPVSAIPGPPTGVIPEPPTGVMIGTGFMLVVAGTLRRRLS